MDAQEQAYITAQYKASIAGIPDEQLPWPEVRQALIDRIERGETLYAYGFASAIKIYHEQPRLDTQAHFTPGEWGATYGYIREYANPDGTLRYDRWCFGVVQPDGTTIDGKEGA